MTPRVLLLASTFPRCEGDHCGRFLGEYVNALELPVTVCAPHTDGASRSERWGERARVERFSVGRGEIAYGGGIPDNLKARPWLAASLPSFFARWVRAAIRLARDVDVIDAHWALPGGLVGAIASKATGVPLRLVLHSGGVHVLSRLPASRAIAGTLAGRSAQLTAVSGPLAQQFGALSGREVDTCPMGVSAQPPIVPDASGALGFRGRLVPVKGTELLVQASASLNRRLLIAGDGPERNKLASQAARVRAEVTFLGPTAETPPASVMVFPSRLLPSGRSEGLPVSLLEAMSAGAAIVAADVGGVRDVVRHGTNGILVPPDDVSELTRAIGDLLASPARRTELGTQARRDAAAFHWATIGPQHREYLCSAANA